MAQLNSLSIGGNTVADFIVESGTDGVWDYVKYNSGRYEAWYRNDGIGPVNISDVYGSIYMSARDYSGFVFDFPSFSTSVTSYTGSGSSTTKYTWSSIWIETVDGVDKLKIRIVSPESATSQTCRVSFQITGRWK